MKVITTGYDGKMGKILADLVDEDENLELVCVSGRGITATDGRFKIYENMSEIAEKADVIIDFSHHLNLDNVLGYAISSKTPLVIATTGYNDEEMEKIKSASFEIPVFQSYNMALGVNIMLKLVKQAAELLKGFDIEIIEKHHNRKVDAPSGTAVMLAEGIQDVLDESTATYGRHGRNAKRQPNEIGIHAVRGGTIVGMHDVIFAGDSEVLTISHQSESRRLFASGAVVSAKYLVNQKPGLYNMDDMLSI